MEDKSELRLQAYEMGLPSPEDLTPLSQSLISPQLALAFGIAQPKTQAQFDLNLSMHDDDNNNNMNYFDSLNTRLKRGDYYGPEETNSGEYGDDNGPNRAVKRPRLVWTPKLHKRFVDVIEHLGVEKAVPKTIMEMMNVDGLTRENVASHLQKYRLYLKRMEGEGQTSLKREPSFFECEGFGGGQGSQGVHCGSLNLMTMPVVPPPPGGGYGGGYGLNVGGGAPSGYCGLESGGYSVFWNRQRG